MTAVHFSGSVITVHLKIENVRELLQKSLAAGALLEFVAPDGRMTIVNPQQVQYLQVSQC